MVFTLPAIQFATTHLRFLSSRRYNLAPCSLLLCFLLGETFVGCKSVATGFHRMHDEITSELIKDDADEDSHYYGAWFTWTTSFDPKEQLLEIEIAGQQKAIGLGMGTQLSRSPLRPWCGSWAERQLDETIKSIPAGLTIKAQFRLVQEHLDKAQALVHRRDGLNERETFPLQCAWLTR
jgi:hypothetical protein